MLLTLSKIGLYAIGSVTYLTSTKDLDTKYSIFATNITPLISGMGLCPKS